MRLFFPVYWGQPHLWPTHNILLHLDLSQASSLQSPFFLISSLNTSLHLFLGLPFTPSPSTCSVSILFIQHNSSLLSIWPNHLSLFHCMTSAMSSIASMLLTHLLLFLSLKLTPVIHLNILISLLYFPYILYLCCPCLSAIQHCRSCACCIDKFLLTSDSSLFL